MNIHLSPKSHESIELEGFRSSLFAKLTTFLTIFLFSSVFYLSPTAKAVADEISKEDRERELREQEITAVMESTPEAKLAYRLQKMKEKVVNELTVNAVEREQEQGLMSRALRTVGFGDLLINDSEVQELQKLKADIELAYQEAIAAFENEAEQLGKNIDASVKDEVQAVIAARHAEAMKHVEARHEQTMMQLDALISASSSNEQKEALVTLNNTLEPEQFKATHTPATPENLPWRAPSDDVREPVEDLSSLENVLDDSSTEKTTITARASVKALPSNSADLNESIEVVFTPEIKALAAQLNNSSVEIYTWVHNNIRFIPSYGSIQGAQHTLESKQGNAIDTASLLISLLRAAGIPARYAYGTIEIPADQVMNWVGGATTPEAAQAILSMGGVPIRGIVKGGQIISFKLEHVWAEAYVDYFPSRGMVEKTGDSWIPMDASFKQYDFTAGMNLQDNVPFDAQALVDSLQAKSTVNDSEGWVQNVPSAEIEEQLNQFQSQLNDYIANQNPDATVGDVLGLQQIKILPPRPLAAGLPYQRVVTSKTFAEVPDNLRHKFKYSLALKSYGISGSPFINVEEPTAKLAGKSLALSFKPATNEDEQIIASRLPAPEADGSIDPNKMPKTLPGYLINLVAEFSIDGQTQKAAPAGTMGTELYEVMGVWSPSEGWNTSVNFPTAGSYRSIGLDLQGANPEQAIRIQKELEVTKGKMQSADEVQLATLTKHQLVGDLLHATLFSYFALNDVQDQIAGQASSVLSYRLPSYGTFSTTLQTQYWYGMPRDVSFMGLSMDIDLIKQQHIAKDNDIKASIAFSRNIGSRMSAMENLVPEQMFSTEKSKVQGISAVKALVIATQQGQKIWTIDSNNLEVALSQINLSSETEADIRNAVLSGKVATTHDESLNFYGWIGDGYLLIDPETGAGAYMISGGHQGGQILPWVDNDTLGFIGFALGLFGGIGLLLSVIIGLRLLYIDLMAINDIPQRCKALAYLMIIPIIFTLVGFFVSPLMAVVAMYTTLITTKAVQAAGNSAICRR